MGGIVTRPQGERRQELSILTLQAVARYATDGFRAGAGPAVRDIAERFAAKVEDRILMHQMRTVQAKHPGPKSKVGAPTRALTEAEKIFPLELQTLGAELRGLVNRIDGPLDYYGNPAGWVPALSLLGNYAAFEKETTSAIQRMYLAYWMEHNQAS